MPVKGFGVQCLETLCRSANLVFRRWKCCACQQIWHSESGNVVPVSECGVKIWKRCACQRIWCSMSGNIVPVSQCGVQSFGTLRFLTSLVLRGWKRCACQGIWCSMSRNAVPVSGFSVQSQSLETLCLSRDLVFNVSKRCAGQRI